MKLLLGKKIILGITASISAYKSPLILRELIKLGADVTIIMTKDATKFVSPLVLSNLSGKNVIIDQFETNLNNDGAWHVKLANNCDLLLIAPLSANTISKISNGICDNALLTVLFSLPIGYSTNIKKVPVILSPAMDFDMWYHPIIKSNIAKLGKIGYKIIEPEEGELASGLVGKGRLPEISVIIEEVIKNLNFSELESQKVSQNEKVKEIESEIDLELEKFSNDNTIHSEDKDVVEDKDANISNNEINNETNDNIIDIQILETSNEETKSIEEEIVNRQTKKIDDIKSKIEQLEAKLKINTKVLTNSLDYLSKPIESISETIENRKFDVELELELLKKKLN